MSENRRVEVDQCTGRGFEVSLDCTWLGLGWRNLSDERRVDFNRGLLPTGCANSISRFQH
jgi:hypothetical protein